MKLRDAGAVDADLIAGLHIASWRSAYHGILDAAYLDGAVEEERRSIWAGRMAQPRLDEKIIIAEQGGMPVGFFCVAGAADPRWGSLVENLHVLPGAKGQGLGAALLGEAARWSLQRYPGTGLYLWVYEANAAARRFYDRMGGTMVERACLQAPDGQSLPELRCHWPDPGILPPFIRPSASASTAG